MPYVYVRSVNRYRDSATGQFVPRDRVLSYVESITRAGGDAADTLSDLVSTGQLSPADYGIRLKDELKSAYVQDYVLGRGGRSSMTRSDWGTIGRMLRSEYRLIDNFVADLEAGKSSPAQTRARARLYFDTAQQAFERANARAFGTPKLPAYPRDQTTDCRSHCYCHWSIEKLDGKGNFDCYWKLDKTKENCPQCLARFEVWGPLQIRDGVIAEYDRTGLFGGILTQRKRRKRKVKANG